MLSPSSKLTVEYIKFMRNISRTEFLIEDADLERQLRDQLNLSYSSVNLNPELILLIHIHLMPLPPLLRNALGEIVYGGINEKYFQ